MRTYVDLEQILINEYSEWMRSHGLKLGSADEHLHDENLTDEQRSWLRYFCRRWDDMQGRHA